MKSWRKLTWFILAVNALFLFWIVSGIASTGKSCAGQVGDSLSSCQAGTAIGASIGVGIIVFFWAIIDLILLVIFLVTNKGQRSCPTCGSRVKVGKTTCPKCSYDFALGAVSA